MKKIFFYLFVWFVLSPIALYSQKDKAGIENAIVVFFDGLSETDTIKLKQQTSADFILLENGETWNLDTLIAKIIPRRNLKIQRTNKFKFEDVQQSGDVAWVSYYNTAEFKMGEQEQTVRWLESAVLQKEKGSWKIKLLHSTKLK